jgi:hypothetical protein
MEIWAAVFWKGGSDVGVGRKVILTSGPGVSATGEWTRRARELGQRLSSAHGEGRGSWAARAEGERGGARLVERVRPGEGEGGSRPGRIAGPKPKGENELFSFSFQNFQSKVLNGF